MLWFPKFWRMDGRRQTGSSLSRVLKRMELLKGPHGMYGTVFGEGFLSLDWYLVPTCAGVFRGKRPRILEEKGQAAAAAAAAPRVQ